MFPPAGGGLRIQRYHGGGRICFKEGPGTGAAGCDLPGHGFQFGSHDRYSVFEEYLEGVSIQKGVCLCAAAGNESQARHHCQGSLLAGESSAIDIKVGEQAGDVYLAIWNTISDRFSASVRSPSEN